MTESLIVGWRSIGQAAQRNPATLARAHSLGTLPVTPQKVGQQVAMTPQQIEQLRRGQK